MGKRRENSGRGNGSIRAGNGTKQARVALEADEVDVILKACRKYRAVMPVYLASAQPEFHTVDEVIRKLLLAQD